MLSPLSCECHGAGVCSLLMLHSSWNNPTVFQTRKWTPKLDNTPHPTPHCPWTLLPHTHPFFPLFSQTNQPTHHPLLPYTHPLVSCPYLGRDVLSAGWRGEDWGGRALGWHKGGRRRNSEHSQPFLNKDMSGIQARLSEKSLSFVAPRWSTLLFALWAPPRLQICVLHAVCCFSQFAVQRKFGVASLL